MSRIITFLKALAFHASLGFPKSTKHQIETRYRTCLGCDQFDKVNSQCLVCGCNISKKSKFLNKLAWKEQKCPLEKW